MSQLEKRALPLIFAIATIGFIMSIVMPSDDFSRHWLIREDGLLESLTAASLLAGAILCGYRCWKLRSCRPKGFLLCTAACGGVLLFGLGEEISWGQRIVGIESPEFFLAHNAQSETNLHNMVLGNTSINKLVFGKILTIGLLLYLLLPAFYLRSRSIRQRLDRLAVPVPRVHQIIAVLALALLVETSGAKKRGEITEFAVSSLGVLVLINPRNLSIFRAGAASTRPDDSITAAPVVLPFAPYESSQSPTAAPEPQRRAAG